MVRAEDFKQPDCVVKSELALEAQHEPADCSNQVYSVAQHACRPVAKDQVALVDVLDVCGKLGVEQLQQLSQVLCWY